jgi:Domain of unknown function (DUF4398)
MSHWMKAAGIGGILVAVGCATTPKPVEQLGQTEGAYRSAQEVGADHVPQAALELKLAQEELTRAQELMKDDHNEEASQMLVRSRADAELALALTRESQARVAAHGADDQLKAAKQSIQ